MKRPWQQRLRPSPRLRFSRKMLVISGISLSVASFLLIIYFQFFRNETIKAQKVTVLTQDQLPDDLHIDQAVITLPDTATRNGVHYKIAKPLDSFNP